MLMTRGRFIFFGVALASGWPEQPNTKSAFAILLQLGMERSSLVVTEKRERK